MCCGTRRLDKGSPANYVRQARAGRRENGALVFDNSGTNVGKTLRKIPDQIMISLQNMYGGCRKAFIIWSSYKERIGDALAPRGEEGRGRLRKAP